MSRERSYEECKKLVAEYATAKELREGNISLYMRIWRMKFWDLLPPGKNQKNYKINELADLSDEQIVEMSKRYSGVVEMQRECFMLYRQMEVRGLHKDMPRYGRGNELDRWNEELLREYFEKKAHTSRAEATRLSRSACRAAIMLGLEHLLPEKRRKKPKQPADPGFRGIMECWRKRNAESQGEFVCGRCEKSAKRSANHSCLCGPCAYVYVQAYMSADLPDILNLGNIKTKYCNISIRLDSGESLYVGLHADADLKRKLVEEGYSFVLKGL